MLYNWIYTTTNDNIYILILIIIILSLIIIDFKLWKKKTDKFYNLEDTVEDIPITTIYQPPMYDNPLNPDFYISKEEEERRNAWSQLDGN